MRGHIQRFHPFVLTMRLSIFVILSLSAPGVLALQQPFDDAPSSSPHPHPQRQHPRPLLRRPPPANDRGGRSILLVSKETYGRLEHFAKYACAAYQFLCPSPLGNTLVQSVCVSSPLLSGMCGKNKILKVSFPPPPPLHSAFSPGYSSRMYSRGRMGSSRAMMDAARSSLRFGGATSSRIWSLV
jgi:hypothetical protein